MRYFKVFFWEHYFYVVDKPTDQVETEISRLIAPGSELDGAVREGKFEIAYRKPAYPIFYNRRQSFSTSHIIGDIEALGHGRTLVSIVLWPDYSFPFFYVASTLGGVAIAISGLLGTDRDLLWIGAVLLLVSHTFVWSLAKYSKDQFRAIFEKTMSVTPFTPQT